MDLKVEAIFSERRNLKRRVKSLQRMAEVNMPAAVITEQAWSAMKTAWRLRCTERGLPMSGPRFWLSLVWFRWKMGPWVGFRVWAFVFWHKGILRRTQEELAAKLFPDDPKTAKEYVGEVVSFERERRTRKPFLKKVGGEGC